MLGRARWTVALLVAASLTAAVPALPAGAQDSQAGTIQGTVVDDTGAPAEGVCVFAQRPDNSGSGGGPGRTNERGAYTLGVDAGTYVLSVYDCRDTPPRYASVFQGGGDRLADAPRVEVSAGQSTSAELVAPRAATVSGTVHFDDGEAAEGECARAFGSASSDLSYRYGLVGADGTYTITGVGPGARRIRFGNCRGGESASATWYRDARGYDEATPVEVTPASPTVGIDGTVRRLASLSGRILDDTGAPVAGACVSLYGATGGPTGNDTCTDREGHWQLLRVRPSVYRLEARASSGSPLLPRFFPGVPLEAAAAPIVVTDAAALTLPDLRLPHGGSIAGRITDRNGAPLARAYVMAQSVLGAEGAGALTDEDGRYVLSPVDAGAFRVKAEGCEQCNFAPGFYGNDPGDSTVPSDGGVQLQLGQRIDGIDIALAPGGTLSGRVLGADGSPVAGICVTAYNGSAQAGADTDAEGRYTLSHLATSDLYYLIWRDCRHNRYATLYSGSTPYEGRAARLRTVAGEHTDYDDVSLQLAGRVSGRVSDARTGVRVENVAVTLQDPGSGERLTGSFTDESGNYLIEGAAPGRYVVAFTDSGANLAVPEYWDDALLREDATPVEVVAEQERSGVDADVLLLTVPSVPRLPEVSPLEEGAVVSWTPPEDDGSAPIETYEVTDQVGTVLTTTEGATTTATITGLVPGTPYSLSVRANNRKGAGPSTEPITVVPQSRSSGPGPTPSPGPGGGTGATSPPAATGDRFAPLPPERVLDTRDGTGGVSGRLTPGRPVSLRVTGRGGVPTSGVRAVVLNTTVTGPSESGYLTVFPDGSPPLASNLNFARGQTVANLVTVPVAADGTVRLVANAGSPHAIADVVGWYGPDAGDAFGPLAPSRVLDTRTGNGLRGRLAPGRVEQLVLRGRGGLPTDGATAVVLNLTATGASASGHLTAFPCGGVPETSNLNYPAGATVPNLAIVPLAPGSSICLQSSAGSPHVVADIVGWFGPGAARGFHGLTPARVIDTRNGTGTGRARLSEGGTRMVRVLGSAGLPQDGVRAVLMNVTVTGPSAAGYLTVHPGGSAPPLASNLNFVRGQTVPNLVVVPVAADGTVSFTSNLGSPHLIADVVGWYG